MEVYYIQEKKICSDTKERKFEIDQYDLSNLWLRRKKISCRFNTYPLGDKFVPFL